MRRQVYGYRFKLRNGRFRPRYIPESEPSTALFDSGRFDRNRFS